METKEVLEVKKILEDLALQTEKLIDSAKSKFPEHIHLLTGDALQPYTEKWIKNKYIAFTIADFTDFKQKQNPEHQE